MLSLDAVPWRILQAWVTLGWEFEHSETSVDHWLEETRMTRLLAMSRTLSLLSRCHRLVPPWEVSGGGLTWPASVPRGSLAVDIGQTVFKRQ